MNLITRYANKITQFLGFQRGYNAILFFIFGGALMGFALARFEFLSFNGVICKPLSTEGTVPGDCYWYRQAPYKAGLLLHLGCMLPASFLVVFQFVPKIRHSFLIFHRVNGYIIILLSLCGNAGALIIARRGFGGTLPSQMVVGILFLLSTFAIINAYWNIKRLQIEQHRAWMLRAFGWMSAIISARLILMATMATLGTLPKSYEFFDNRPCDQLASIAGPELLYSFYPECQPPYANTSTAGRVIIRATMNSDNPYEKVAASGVSSGATTTLALIIHLVAVELYLALTPREAQRLRQVSYERQLAAGFKNPGNGGLVIEKFGDADPWVPNHGTGSSSDGTDDLPKSSEDSSGRLEKGGAIAVAA